MVLTWWKVAFLCSVRSPNAVLSLVVTEYISFVIAGTVLQQNHLEAYYSIANGIFYDSFELHVYYNISVHTYCKKGVLGSLSYKN